MPSQSATAPLRAGLVTTFYTYFEPTPICPPALAGGRSETRVIPVQMVRLGVGSGCVRLA